MSIPVKVPGYGYPEILVFCQIRNIKVAQKMKIVCV